MFLIVRQLQRAAQVFSVFQYLRALAVFCCHFTRNNIAVL
jgi:hypothetical protein